MPAGSLRVKRQLVEMCMQTQRWPQQIVHSSKEIGARCPSPDGLRLWLLSMPAGTRLCSPPSHHKISLLVLRLRYPHIACQSGKAPIGLKETGLRQLGSDTWVWELCFLVHMRDV